MGSVFSGRLFSCSQIMAGPAPEQLPADVAMNKGAGSRTWLIVKLQFGEEELRFTFNAMIPGEVGDRCSSATGPFRSAPSNWFVFRIQREHRIRQRWLPGCVGRQYNRPFHLAPPLCLPPALRGYLAPFALSALPASPPPYPQSSSPPGDPRQ